MRQGSNRRPRPRGNQNKQRSGGGRNSYDSNGPAGKVRGTAQQVLDKYQALGRDAMTSGDRIAAESYFQFAEHYHRIVDADASTKQDSQHPAQDRQNNQNNQDRRPRQNTEQPDVVVEVPVTEASVSPADTPPASDEARVEVAAVEDTVAGSGDEASPAPEAEEIVPKAPRRRRSRAKVETPAPVDA